MKDLLKTIFWVFTLQWLLQKGGCGTLLTTIVLLICFALYMCGAL